MKYRYTNTQIRSVDENGKEVVYAICDACGKKHQTNFGMEFSIEKHSELSRGRMKLCGKCAKKLLPKIFEAIENTYNEANKMRKSAEEKE